MGTALALVAPWLVWLPFVRAPVTIDVLGAIAIAGAWHGWGRLVARAARCEVDAVLAIAWGVAATVFLGGLLMALHLYDARLIVIAGTVAHSIDLVRRWPDGRPAISRYSLVPLVAIAAVAAIAVLAAAGQVTARPFDDDGSVIAQIKRLADTGTLGDAIGYPRTSQLGGHVVLAGLASAFADANRARLVDAGLGLALVLALGFVRIRARDAVGATWLVLIAVAACVFVAPGTDLAPLWLPAAIVIALDATLAREDRVAIPIALLAGSLAAIRSEVAPAALAFVVGAWWIDRPSAPHSGAARPGEARPGDRTRTRDDLRRALVPFGGFVVVLAPYAVARAVAWHHVDVSVHALVEPPHGAMLAKIALFAAIALAAVPLALLPVRELERRGLRVTAVACAVGIASVTAFGVRPYASHAYWPIAVGGVMIVAIAAAHRREVPAIALVLSAFALLVIHDAQAATGRTTSWSWRTYDMMFDVEYARHAAPEGGGYDQLLAPVPRDETVAVWVGRPELLDYAAHRIVDLRTPRVARTGDRIGAVVTASRARWLLVEDDAPQPLAALGHAIASGGRARLIELR